MAKALTNAEIVQLLKNKVSEYDSNAGRPLAPYRAPGDLLIVTDLFDNPNRRTAWQTKGRICIVTRHGPDGDGDYHIVYYDPEARQIGEAYAHHTTVELYQPDKRSVLKPGKRKVKLGD